MIGALAEQIDITLKSFDHGSNSRALALLH
jgi:hypothetical protein